MNESEYNNNMYGVSQLRFEGVIEGVYWLPECRYDTG